MAQASTIKINPSLRCALQQMAEASGESVQVVLAKAVEEYRRKQFFAQLDESFARLKRSEAAWRDEVADRNELADVLEDGLDKSEAWTQDGRLVTDD